ncbi:hypothetical protein Tco_1078162 [Tanacetum coccineum]
MLQITLTPKTLLFDVKRRCESLIAECRRISGHDSRVQKGIRGTMMYMTEKVDIRTETNWEEMQAAISVMEGSGKHHEDEPSSRRSQYVE